MSTSEWTRACTWAPAPDRPEKKKSILGQLRGLGSSHVPRKRCHVTLEYLGGHPRHIDPGRLIRELSILTNFELLILDARIADWDKMKDTNSPRRLGLGSRFMSKGWNMD